MPSLHHAEKVLRESCLNKDASESAIKLDHWHALQLLNLPGHGLGGCFAVCVARRLEASGWPP